MHDVVVHPPEVDGRRVRFRWSVEPASELYRRCAFSLTFPEGVPIAGLPERVWWWVALACLHPHWVLLEPCRVRLPVRLGPGEREVWLRLLSAVRAGVDAHSRRPPGEPRVEIEERGPELPPLEPPREGAPCAAAFSGGKDSLLQAGLLAELDAPPLLVATTSPLPKLEDHLVPRRRQVFRRVVERRPFGWIEVESDYRSAHRNRFSVKRGFGVTVNELTDTLLYTGALVAAGLARGATRFFVASEAEVQENAEREGRIVQHPHAMYATTTLRALAAALAPAGGVELGSLIVPLHSWQVQRLLWTRYPELCDLQFSCWHARGRQAACNACTQCLRVAYGALAAGGRPSRMGVDLRRLLRARGDWTPRGPVASPLPDDVARAALHAQAARLIADTPLARVEAELRRGPLPLRLDPGARRALAAAAALRDRMAAHDPPPLPGMRTGFERQLDPRLREAVGALYREHFDPEETGAYAGTLARSEALAAWLTEPLRAGLEEARA